MSIKTTNAIMRQIEALEEACRTQLNGKIKVIFADGNIRWIEPGDGILLALHPDGEIIDFQGKSEGNGMLVELLRGLLAVDD